MKPLTTLQLNKILMNNPVTKKMFVGTFPGCVLPSTKANEYSFITNTDLHHQSGEHWNAWIVRGKHIIFFDSFGRDPRDKSFPDSYKNIIENFDSFEYSKYQLQDFSSVTCGYFCVHFIYTLSLGLNLKSFLSEYGDNYRINDISVVEFVKML